MKRIFLISLVFGAMVASCDKYDDSAIDGLILTGSPTRVPMSWMARALSWFMCSVGLSRLRMSFSQTLTSWRYNRRFAKEGHQAWTCSDPRSREEFMTNPVCNFKISANLSYNILSLMSETYAHGKWMVSKPYMPVLFLSGADDPLMRGLGGLHRSAQNICKRGYRNVTSVLYPDMRHEVLNETGKQEVWDDILDFMDIRTYAR